MMPDKKFSLFADPRMSGGKKAREITSKTIIYIVLIIMSIIWLVPFVYLIIQSFATTYEASLIVPRNWTINNYRALFDQDLVLNLGGKDVSLAKTYPFWRWYLNTFVIALVVSVLNTILTLVSAYAFSRLRFKARKGYMRLILIIGMFPGFLGMIITYYILKQVNLNQGMPALFGLVLVYISGCVMNYYVAKGYFDTISTSLDEAAMIDGANKNTIFWRVIMPLSKPIVVYTILLAFTAPWGDYMLASVMAGGDNKLFNVAVGLQQMLSKEAGTSYFPIFCAAAVIVSIPIMILFFALQSYYVEGVTGGAVKG
ncbi:MAG: ABC transporter permease subunit [Anaeroplasmataceae bacterium]|nr:ABC transporter permease subunit [Anaeroplasmataceae bacterium]